MGRLIDADVLNKELQKRVGSPTDDKLYEVNLCIIDATTIDAIPVAWLEDKLNATAVTNPDLNNAIFYVLVVWEQEKKNHEQ